MASAVLANRQSRFRSLESSPLPGGAKTIDFRATADDVQVAYVDVRTIKPENTDRWDQFERATSEGWFPENVIISISEKRLGAKSGTRGSPHAAECWNARNSEVLDRFRR
jgi:hypothetical protein